MKRIIKYLLCLILIFALISNVNAVTITTNTTAGTVDTNSKLVTNTGTITINDVVSTDTFAAYKIMDTFYNSTNNTITYEFTNTFKTFLAASDSYRTLTVEQYQALTSGNITNGSTTTTSTLDTLVSKFAAYIKTNGTTGSNMTVSGTTATASLPAGSYLVLPTTTKKVYAVMVGNIYFTGNGTDWTLNNATIKAKVSNAGVTKVIKETSSTEGTFSKGEEYTYQINATIPTYPTNATNKALTITDTLDSGINFKGMSTVLIKDGETSLSTKADGTVVDNDNHTVATITKTGQEITINFNSNYLTSNNVTIEYKAELNENATLGTTGNNTSTKITYANNPYATGTTDSTPVTTTINTYGIDLFKHNSGGTGLEGAVYTVYSNSSLTTEVGTITTGTNGHGTILGLADGTYYLKEKTSPTGYKINNNTITVSIDTTTNYTTADAVDEQMGLLPVTGGIGTYIFIIIGAVIAISAILLVIKNKKKNAREK